MGAIQRIMFLVRAVAILQAIMASPIGRRAIALNRKATAKPKTGPRLVAVGRRAIRRDRRSGSDMKFIVGVLFGIVIGAAGAVLYSVKSGRDLREALDDIRADLEKRDMDAVGSRLEARFTAMQSQLEERIGQVRERAAGGTDVSIETAGEAVSDAASEAVDAVTDTVAEATSGS